MSKKDKDQVPQPHLKQSSLPVDPHGFKEMKDIPDATATELGLQGLYWRLEAERFLGKQSFYVKKVSM